MSKLGLIHGAFLFETEGRYFQVGDTKEPANYESAGFEKPVDFDPMESHFTELTITGKPEIKEPYLTFKDEGEELCEKIYQRLVIGRNASTSTRMWYLFFDADEYSGQRVIDIQWLLDIPAEIWEIIQDEVWSC
ncbi:MAG: hypothetical protein NE330_07600 [Lentisphaeraceae bacterium]|nr:hypothetical protein [Lentisphaeraceae bacterium]